MVSTIVVQDIYIAPKVVFQDVTVVAKDVFQEHQPQKIYA